MSGGSGKKGTETHCILQPILADLLKLQLDHCVERVTHFGLRTDGDVRNYWVVKRALKIFIDKYCDANGVYVAANGRRYNITEDMGFVCHSGFRTFVCCWCAVTK